MSKKLVQQILLTFLIFICLTLQQGKSQSVIRPSPWWASEGSKTIVFVENWLFDDYLVPIEIIDSIRFDTKLLNQDIAQISINVIHSSFKPDTARSNDIIESNKMVKNSIHSIEYNNKTNQFEIIDIAPELNYLNKEGMLNMFKSVFDPLFNNDSIVDLSKDSILIVPKTQHGLDLEKKGYTFFGTPNIYRQFSSTFVSDKPEFYIVTNKIIFQSSFNDNVFVSFVKYKKNSVFHSSYSYNKASSSIKSYPNVPLGFESSNMVHVNPDYTHSVKIQFDTSEINAKIQFLKPIGWWNSNIKTKFAIEYTNSINKSVPFKFIGEKLADLKDGFIIKLLPVSKHEIENDDLHAFPLKGFPIEFVINKNGHVQKINNYPEIAKYLKDNGLANHASKFLENELDFGHRMYDSLVYQKIIDIYEGLFYSEDSINCIEISKQYLADKKGRKGIEKYISGQLIQSGFEVNNYTRMSRNKGRYSNYKIIGNFVHDIEGDFKYSIVNHKFFSIDPLISGEIPEQRYSIKISKIE